MDAGMDFPLQKGIFFIGDGDGHWEEVAFEDALRTVMKAVSTRRHYEFTIDPLNNKIFIKCGHLAAKRRECDGEHDAARSAS